MRCRCESSVFSPLAPLVRDPGLRVSEACGFKNLVALAALLGPLCSCAARNSFGRTSIWPMEPLRDEGRKDARESVMVRVDGSWEQVWRESSSDSLCGLNQTSHVQIDG